MKKITHREVGDIPGRKYDEYKKQAEVFVKDMHKIAHKVLKNAESESRK